MWIISMGCRQDEVIDAQLGHVLYCCIGVFSGISPKCVTRDLL